MPPRDLAKAFVQESRGKQNRGDLPSGELT